METMRLYTPCCGVPLLGRPFQCMDEWRAFQASRTYPPACWIGQRPRRELVLGL